MRLFRAKFGFYDDEWCGMGDQVAPKLVRHFIAKGTVIGIDDTEPTPMSKFWEELVPMFPIVKGAQTDYANLPGDANEKL